MKKLIALLLASVALLSLCACQKTCKYDNCDRTPLEGGDYCARHTCEYPGCLEYGILWWYDEGHYCQEHWGQIHDEVLDAESPFQVLEITCGVALDGVAYWEVVNNGKCTYKTVEIELTYKDEYGKEKFTKAVYCHDLKPGANESSAHETMYCEKVGTVTARIVDFEKAN